jgi:acetone carboxylase, gamma subunit
MSNDTEVSRELIRQLVDGTIDDDNAERLLKLPRKDKERFFNYLAVLQDRVPWNDRILLRLGDRIYIVAKPTGERIVQCECGHGFGDYRENWKLKCKIRTRKTLAEMSEVYSPAPAVPEPGWQEVREFFCPTCATQHAVEVVAPGYPIMFEMLPDLDRFYRDYLGQPLTDEREDWYSDRSATVTAGWRSA